jgi:hypothetical protein
MLSQLRSLALNVYEVLSQVCDPSGHLFQAHLVILHLSTSQYIVASMDPAMSGDTFSVVIAGDRTTQKRYLLEASRMPAPTPAADP